MINKRHMVSISLGWFACTLTAVATATICGPADLASGHDSPAQVSLIAPQSDQSWSDYEIIVWQPQTPARLAGLARLGVTAGTIFGERGEVNLAKIPEETQPFLALHLRWYIENIATDFYAPYHRWHPNHPVTWQFDETKRLHRQEPANLANFVRAPSLSDPVWLRDIAQRLEQHVRAYAPYSPLFYNLSDEPGIADLTAAWDFDFAPASLAAMRLWLEQSYGTLAALNREWETHFPHWDAVTPLTTDGALKQPDENFAAWADFKEWMDVAFARAVRTGTEAVHAAAPRARAALEGAQPPGWGGYNYSHLAAAVDVIEMHNDRDSVEIARSFAPNLITLTASSLADGQQIHSVWHELLLGARGLILWDPNNSFVADDGTPTPQGRSLAALAAELRSGLAAQLIASTPKIDPVAILYSPASQRIQWLLDRKSDGKPWAERESETEYLDDNPVRAAWQRAARILAHLGLQPHWLTPAMVEEGVLGTGQIRVLLLPHAIALSSEEARQIRDFATTGGVVLADFEPGLFDAHGRRLAQPQLADLTGAGGPVVLMPELQQDPKPGDPTSLARVQQILEKAGIKPLFTLSTPGGGLAADIDARVFRNGDTSIIALQRDEAGRGDDVGQDIVLGLKKPGYIYDLRHPSRAQHAAEITLTLDVVAPALIAIAPTPLPTLAVGGPSEARLGTLAEFTVMPLGTLPAAERIVHVEASAPDGTVIPAYTTNIAVRGGRATWQLPLSLNDPVGKWTIRMVDVLDGQTMRNTLEVLGGAAAPFARSPQ